MADDEEMSLEKQLELQLDEQKESLTAINEALVSDSTNTELLSVHGELVLAIKDAEEGLFHLKRSRLLEEADVMLSESIRRDVQVEPLDSTNSNEVPPLEVESNIYSVGSTCRFRHTDGRWYNGRIVDMDGSGSARVTFLTPTSDNMLICQFFLQQRCRFGSNCRMSHGFDVPIASLKQYVPTKWQNSLAGSSIWAISDINSGIWRRAELESWDEDLGIGHVVFRKDGSSAKLGSEDISLSEYAQMSDEDEEDQWSSEEYDSSGNEEEEIPQGIGFMEATMLQRGIQTDTAVFANWEHHTRGIASKMMASMGYREGMGLGASGQGILDPILVKVLKPKQSLDHAFESHENGEGNNKNKSKNHVKRRCRGGKRKRDKKFAAAARAAKTAEELTPPDVFSFINGQLASQGKTQKNKSLGEEKKQDRRSLVAYDDDIKELRTQVEKLEEMVNRNRKEKAVYEAFSRKLSETRKALADKEAAQASASNAVVSKEKEKRWLKF
ncbi:hypothetical protein MKW94_010823 [Papaver nudicaule]|uniref:Zinc finger CCCH-type with G patch domain-containing protein n=1 Tax=Papaver nudicaule TaxID=74823 RepID=A0AA41V970_PAPNU|nr:hypothetical protein [Papaver nudicaule]